MPVILYSYLGASVTFTMPFTFSVAEYADMIHVCGFCDSNSVHAIAEYQQRFRNRRIPTRRLYTRVYQTLQDTGTLPGVRIAAEPGVNEGVDEEEDCTKQSTCEYAKNCKTSSCSPTRGCEEHCMQRACIHTTCSECNNSDLAILLRGWNFASGLVAVAN